MLLSTAVVPGPPALVADLMGSAAHELDDLRAATDAVVARIVADLVATSADSLRPGPGPGPDPGPGPRAGSATGSVQLVVVGPGEPAELKATGVVSFAEFGRDITVPAVVEEAMGRLELPTSIMVARYLASRDIAANPGHAPLWAGARWITTSGHDASVLGEQLRGSSDTVGLILVADGAACHGPKAPRAQDLRARTYDEGVCAALASGRPDRLAEIDADLGAELGATGFQVWPVLVAAAGGVLAVERQEWAGEVMWAGAPYGVGWTVASWRSCQ